MELTSPTFNCTQHKMIGRFLIETGGAEVNDCCFEIERFQNPVLTQPVPQAQFAFGKKPLRPQKSTAVM